jgi:hypothetical protein
MKLLHMNAPATSNVLLNRWVLLMAGLACATIPVGLALSQNSPQQSVPQSSSALVANNAAPAADATGAAPKTKVTVNCAELLNLATSLKTEVAKSNPDTLSVAVVRKAALIEELAHRMRTESRNAPRSH